jgi:hypothetical protein
MLLQGEKGKKVSVFQAGKAQENQGIIISGVGAAAAVEPEKPVDMHGTTATMIAEPVRVEMGGIATSAELMCATAAVAAAEATDVRIQFLVIKAASAVLGAAETVPDMKHLGILA